MHGLLLLPQDLKKHIDKGSRISKRNLSCQDLIYDNTEKANRSILNRQIWWRKSWEYLQSSLLSNWLLPLIENTPWKPLFYFPDQTDCFFSSIFVNERHSIWSFFYFIVVYLSRRSYLLSSFEKLVSLMKWRKQRLIVVIVVMHLKKIKKCFVLNKITFSHIKDCFLSCSEEDFEEETPLVT